MDAKPSQEPSVEPVSSVTPIVAPKPAARSVGPGGGPLPAPAARSGPGALYARLKENPWFAVGSRGLGIFAGMLALAAVGAASTLAGQGIPVAVPKTSPAVPSSSGVWVAPDPPAGSTAPPARGPEAPRTETAADDGTQRAAAATSSGGVTPDGKVILNVATADELTKLPKVGPKRAQAILDLRRKLGRFRQPTDLLRVRGIGRKTLKRMLPLLVVDPPNNG